MIFLLIGIACSAMVSIFMRLSAGRSKNNFTLLAFNYLTCSIVACFYTAPAGLLPQTPDFPAALGMGIIHGILYLAALMLFQRSVQKNGVVLSSVFMKLGLLVPLVLSIFLFREIPTLVQCLGFCIAIISIILINDKVSATAGVSFGGLVILLLCSGGADAMTKIFETLGPKGLSPQFLLYTFVTACLLAVTLVLKGKQGICGYDVLFGVLVGIPNFFSTKFLLRALDALPGVIAYPTFSVGTLLVVTMTGAIAFRERLSKKQWIAVAVILAALTLLNI